MYNIDYVIIKGLFSHKDTRVDFKQNDVTLINSINKDDEGCDGNGAGKSTIIEAIVLAYSGETIRDVTKDDFINDECDTCYVEMGMTNTFRKEKVIISRKFHRKHRIENTLVENGVVNKEITDPNLFNAYIISKVGITKKDFLTYYVIGGDAGKPFICSTDSEKKDTISRFSNISKIDDVLDVIEDEASQNDGDYKELVQIRNSIEESIAICKNTIAVKTESFNETKKNNVEQLTQQYAKVQVRLKENDEDVEKKRITLEAKKLELEKIVIDGKSKEIVSNKIDKAEENKDLAVSKLRKLKNNKETHLQSLNHSIDCPNCKHSFIIESELTIDQIKEAIKAIEKDIVIVDKEKLKYTEEITALEAKYKKLSENDYKVKLLKENITDLTNSLNRMKNLSVSFKSELEGIRQSIGKEKIKKIETVLKKHQDELSELEGELLVTDELFQTIDETKQKYDFWRHHFSKKGFVSFLANKVISSIEGMTNLYLKKYNTNLSVEISGFTKLKNGEMREKIDVFILRDGHHVGKFNRFSSGQKARVNMASILSTHSLINNSCESGGLNFLALDEKYDESLDQRGKTLTIQLLEDFGVTSLMILQSTSPIEFKNVITVEYKDKISNIL